MKKIRPDSDWKTALKSEIFEGEFFYMPDYLEKTVGALALASLLLAVFTVGLLSNYFGEIEQIESEHKETEMVDFRREVVAMEIDRNKEVLDHLIFEVEIEELTEREKLELAKEGARALIEEVENTEDRISKMITMME